MRAAFALSAALLGLATAPAVAAEGPAKVMQAATYADLESAVTGMGHTIEAKDPPKQSLRATTPEGTSYILSGTACDIDGVPGCRGVVMQVLFLADGKVTLESLAEANREQVAVSTRFDPGTDVVSVTRYLVLDGGVTMANIAQNIATLLALAPAVMVIASGEAAGSNSPD